jgi:hypothetical protein
MTVSRSTPVEDLVQLPGATTLLIRRGLPCLVCGEPAWGTLEELAKGEGMDEAAIDELLRLLNDLCGENQS